MRIGLDDNTRDALHFVLLGAGVLLVVRLLIAGVQLLLGTPLSADLPALIATFRNGYLVTDPSLLVSGGMDLPGRLAVAGVLAVCAGIGLAIPLMGIAYAMQRNVLRSALRGGRAGLLLAAAWGLYAALILPPTSASVRPQGLLITQRTALFSAVSLPWPAAEHMLPWARISAIEQETIARSFDGCGTQARVVATTTEGSHVIADLTPRGPDCETSQRDAFERTTRLAELLKYEFGAAQVH